MGSASRRHGQSGSCHPYRRAWRHDVLEDCTNRDTAWRNWMERDVGIARHVVGEAAALGRTFITVDETCPTEAILDAARKQLGLS